MKMSWSWSAFKMARLDAYLNGDREPEDNCEVYWCCIRLRFGYEPRFCKLVSRSCTILWESTTIGVKQSATWGLGSLRNISLVFKERNYVKQESMEIPVLSTAYGDFNKVLNTGYTIHVITWIHNVRTHARALKVESNVTRSILYIYKIKKNYYTHDSTLISICISYSVTINGNYVLHIFRSMVVACVFLSGRITTMNSTRRRSAHISL